MSSWSLLEGTRWKDTEQQEEETQTTTSSCLCALSSASLSRKALQKIQLNCLTHTISANLTIIQEAKKNEKITLDRFPVL